MSASALQEYERAAENANLVFLVVQEDRELSNEIARRFSIRHESPQAIVLKNGAPVAVLNHEEIQASAIIDHLKR